MAKGTIRRLMDRGFGFIKSEQGEDLFFHSDDVEGVEFNNLNKGQEVEFETSHSRDGRPKAVHVKLAEAPAETPTDDSGDGDHEGTDEIHYLTAIDFGNEAADDIDSAELIPCFVEQQQFKKFTNSDHKILIATARKGVGKSALLQWISHTTGKNDSDALVIKCRGADLVRNKFNLVATLKTPNDYIRDWTIRICALVNRELALKFNLNLSDDRITLVETAEMEGYKSRNFVSCLVDRLQGLSTKGMPAKLLIKDEYQMFKRIKDRKVWFVIDDLDATFQNTPAELLELSTFFSACRYLCQDVKDIYFRVTMRTEVWAMLRRYDESLDKMEQYINEIHWSLSDFRRLLYLRIKSQIENTEQGIIQLSTEASKEDYNHIMGLVFAPTMLWAKKMTPSYRVIYILSYERPRWAIQLLKLAQQSAIRQGASHISKDFIDEVWGEYGAKRIADLVAEHKHQCGEIQELLNSFRGAERLMTRDQLFAWINKRVSEHILVIIEGKSTRSPRDIAQFLFRIGFIVARSDEEDMGYEHYRFDQMPDFLMSRTDEDFSVKWEIHPCYRQALDIRKLNRSHRERFAKLRGRDA